MLAFDSSFCWQQSLLRLRLMLEDCRHAATFQRSPSSPLGWVLSHQCEIYILLEACFLKMCWTKYIILWWCPLCTPAVSNPLTWNVRFTDRKSEKRQFFLLYVIVVASICSAHRHGKVGASIWMGRCVSTDEQKLFNLRLLLLFDISLYRGTPSVRQTIPADKQQAASDWLSPHSLGTMSASGYIENLA